MAIKKYPKKAAKKTTKPLKKGESQQKKVSKTKHEKSVKKRIPKPVAMVKKPVKVKKITPVSKDLSKRIPKTTELLGEKKEALRRYLIQKREQIVKEAKSEISKYIKGETRQLVDTALDDGDWSIVDLSEDVSLRQLGTHRDTLLKIDESLRKLNEGTYGICEDCGGDISEERLKIMPFAIYCRDCQEKIEQLAAIAKELT
ncbi:MAG: TraR/DksA C4-type zinc finger protein [Nitrospirae bacterium]|nr:TraR/DksA C4-type zinc finger protein [Nitrospirota bacterium]